MRLYLDQMFHIDLARWLRNEGHDVLTASEDDCATADDAEALSRAIDQDRVLVTLDKHFGNWLTLRLAKHSGVIRVKVSPTTTDQAAPLLIALLRRHKQADFRNRLVIVSQLSERWITTAED